MPRFRLTPARSPLLAGCLHHGSDFPWAVNMNTTLARYRWVGWAVSFLAFCAWAQAALVITAQPQSLYANLGSNVTFSVTATASSAITYQWQFNGQNLAGANASSLSITNVQAYQTGTYSVAVTGDATTLNSVNAQLTVVTPPVVTSQPTPLTAFVGGNFSIYPNVSGSYPLSYQWMKDGVVIPNATFSYYNVNGVTMAAAGSYTVTVTNAAGSVTTNPTVVTVVAAISITTNPLSQTVDAGSSVTLSAAAVGPGTLQYTWYKEGNYLGIGTSSTLTLTNVTGAQSGNYHVNVKNEYDTNGLNSSTAALTVKAPPVVVSQPQATVQSTVGSSFSLSVAAGGAGPLTYQWRKDGVALTAGPRRSGITDYYFWISGVTAADAGTYSVVVTNAFGSTTSADAVVTTSANPNGPVITLQPASQSVLSGGVVLFSVTATGPSFGSPPRYQWQKNGSDIAGAVSANYTIPSVAMSDAGNYTVIVTNDFASAISDVARLTVGAAAAAPVISQHPISQSAAVGDTVTLSVIASGNPTPTYQWKKDGVALSGATSSTLTLANVQTSDSGAYLVVVSNVAGTATSAPAAITVGMRTRVVNLSTRAQVGTDANILIAGFIINGTTPKKMLIRAVGPTLSQFAVDGVLANPFLRIANVNGDTVASNDDWSITSNLPDLVAAQTQTGAFPLQKDSKDAALVVTLAPGSYTALISGVNSTAGVVLAELYEVDTTTTNQLINISARAFVGTGSKVLIPGIIVSGDTPKKFLVRAVGPGLKQFSVDGALADPKLEVVNSAGQTIAVNDDWSISDNLVETKSVTQSLNIFALDAGSKDAAAVVTLAPGNYTVVVHGVGDTTGVALVELYQVP